eukprot:1925528-Pyramimonas_sp.AAC.1
MAFLPQNSFVGCASPRAFWGCPGRPNGRPRPEAWPKDHPNPPLIADRGPIAPPRPGTCGSAIEVLSPIYRRCIADSRSIFP